MSLELPESPASRKRGPRPRFNADRPAPGQKDVRELLDDTQNPNITFKKVDEVNTTPTFSKPMTQAAKDLLYGKPEANRPSVDRKVRPRHKGPRDAFYVSDEEKVRLGIRPDEVIQWVRNPLHWQAHEKNNRVSEVKRNAPGARVIFDPDMKEPVQNGDIVMMVVPKEYVDEQQAMIDNDGAVPFSNRDSSDGSYMPDLSQDMAMSGKSLSQNYERMSKGEREVYNNMRSHMNAREAMARGWMGPASHTQGLTMAQVLRNMKDRMGGNEEAAKAHMISQRIESRNRNFRGEVTRAMIDHEVSMQRAFESSGERSVSYSIPSTVGPKTAAKK